MAGFLGSFLPEFFKWLPFFSGQCLFILKRMGLAVRSPLNAMKSRRQYLKQNWDILLIRTVIEFIAVYFPYQHSNLFETYLPKWWAVIPASWVVPMALGYLADSMLDWILGKDKIFGVPIPDFIKETIPQLPEVQNLVAQLGEIKAAQPPVDVPQQP